ncbi:hypothetical protein BJ165DRAFT_1457161 [Panaeolus papilionaceus]|nr:hypothetical protein BJ165DRAFT_1457161 [Panaeolus papilionaceus]
MLARGLDTETVLLLTHLRDRWTCGMLWGDKGIRASTTFPRRLSARRIVEDHFAGLDPRQMSQEEKDTDAHWKQDEVKRLDNEVRRMEEAEKEECAAEEDSEGSNETPEAQDNEATSEEPEPSCSEDRLEDTNSEIDMDIPADTEARIGKLIRLHAEKSRADLLIQELKANGVSEADSRIQELMGIAEKNDQKLCKYWEKVTGLPSSHSLEDIANNNKSIDLVGHHELGSSQMIEQAIQSLLHPHAKSLKLSIKIGKSDSKVNVQIREATIVRILGQYGLPSDVFINDQRCGSVNSATGRVERKIALEGQGFRNWLESVRLRF